MAGFVSSDIAWHRRFSPSCARLTRFLPLLPFLLSLLLPACSEVQPSQPGAAQTTPQRVWPDPPEQARIAYLQSVQRPADLGIKRSAFTRFGQWLTGSQKGNEPLVKPFGISLDEHDNLCLTDTGANAVCFYDQAKKKWSRWDQIGRIKFASPVSVAKRNDIFYVVDSTLGNLVGFNDSGKLIFATTNHLSRPTGVTILDDQVYVVDSQRHAVVCFDLNGRFSREFGRRGVGQGDFNFPTHISADEASHQLLVTDSMNSRVQILTPQGSFVAQVGEIGDSPGHFSRPKGASVDSLGNVYVIDALFDNIQIFDKSGRLLLNLGAAGAGPGEFWLPNGITISRSNTVFVADSYNRRVQVFQYVGPL